jgi:phosphate transport system substrate-binding protein
MNRNIMVSRASLRCLSRRVFALLAFGVAFALAVLPPSQPCLAAGEAESINGAGATFPMPVYSEWAIQYNRNTGLKINYQGVGSGAGIAQIKEKAVDFGASDEPLNADVLEKQGLFQFPMIMGGVVPVVNLPDIRKGKLKLTPELLADMFLGKIKQWNDRRIMALNPDLKLPGDEITVVHRADGSGTTWIFTSYLSKVSPEWKEKIGSGKSVSWPTGIGGKGNPGVAALVKKTPGTIGYVEFAYAVKEKLKYTQLQNRDGRFVTPSNRSFQAAAENADWEGASAFVVELTDQPGAPTWPIVGVSYILMHKDQQDLAKATAMLKFFDWCFRNGGEVATRLDYVPMPSKVYKFVQTAWQKDVSSSGRPVALK